MKIKLVTFQVENIEKSLKFYRDILGMSIVEDIRYGDLRLVFLGNDGEVHIELVCNSKAEYIPQISNNMSVGIEFDNVTEIVACLKEHNYKVEGPICPNPETTFYITEDNNGFRIQLITV